jgi:transketolase C-terminal domain/subunit
MRAYEFIRDEICFNNLDVKLIGTGAAGFLGFSHNLVDNENIEDLLKNLPIKVYNPTESELNIVLKSIGSAFIKI